MKYLIIILIVCLLISGIVIAVADNEKIKKDIEKKLEKYDKTIKIKDMKIDKNELLYRVDSILLGKNMTTVGVVK